MKTVSREVAQNLKDAGWVKETHFEWVKKNSSWVLWGDFQWSEMHTGKEESIPAPTLDEVLEELTYQDMINYYAAQENPSPPYPSWIWEKEARQWLYLVMSSADVAAEVWLKRGKI